MHASTAHRKTTSTRWTASYRASRTTTPTRPPTAPALRQTIDQNATVKTHCPSASPDHLVTKRTLTQPLQFLSAALTSRGQRRSRFPRPLPRATPPAASHVRRRAGSGHTCVRGSGSDHAHLNSCCAAECVYPGGQACVSDKQWQVGRRTDEVGGRACRTRVDFFFCSGAISVYSACLTYFCFASHLRHEPGLSPCHLLPAVPYCWFVGLHFRRGRLDCSNSNHNRSPHCVKRITAARWLSSISCRSSSWQCPSSFQLPSLSLLIPSRRAW